jgi:hypothetical protein
LKIAESKANNRITSFHSHAKPWRRTRIFRSSFLQGNKFGGHLIVIGSAANLAQIGGNGIAVAPSTKTQGMVGNPPILAWNHQGIYATAFNPGMGVMPSMAHCPAMACLQTMKGMSG